MKPILDGFDLIEMVRHFYHPPDSSGFALIMAAMKAFDEADPNARRSIPMHRSERPMQMAAPLGKG